MAIAGGDDRLERRQNLLAAVFKPRRQLKLGAQLVGWLVSSRIRRGTLQQHSTRIPPGERTYIEWK